MPLVEIKDGQATKVGLWPGTVIKFPDGRRFKVTKLNPVNVKVMDEQGKDGYTCNRTYAETLIDKDQTWEGPAEKTEYAKHLERVDAGITIGTTVKLTEARLKNKYGDHVWVVFNLPSNGTLKLVKLGGDGGRYLRNIELSDVEVVTV